MIWKIQIESYVQKVIPTFTKKNSLFISFSDNGRDNEKVGITMVVFDTPKGCVGVWKTIVLVQREQARLRIDKINSHDIKREI